MSRLTDYREATFQEGPDWDNPFGAGAGGEVEQKLPSASEVQTALRNGSITLAQAQDFIRQINANKPSFVTTQALAELNTIAAEADPAGALAGNYGPEAQEAATTASRERQDEAQAGFALSPADAAAAVLGGFISEEQAVAQIQQAGEFTSASAARAELNRLMEGGRNRDGSLSSDMQKRINAVGGQIQVSQEGAISGALGGLGQGDQLGATTPFPVLGPTAFAGSGASGGTGGPAGAASITQALDAQYQRQDTGDLGQLRWQTPDGRIVSYDGGRSFQHEFIDPETGTGMRSNLGFSNGQVTEGLPQRSHNVTRLAMSPGTGFPTQPFSNLPGASLQEMLEGITGLELTEDLPDIVDLFAEFDPARSQVTHTPALDRSVLAQVLDNLGLRQAALAEALGRSPTVNEIHNLGSSAFLGVGPAQQLTARNLSALQQTGLLASKPRANPALVRKPLAEPGATAAEREFGAAQQKLGAVQNVPGYQGGGSVTADPLAEQAWQQHNAAFAAANPQLPEFQSNAEAALALQPFGDFDTMTPAERLIFTQADGGEFLGSEFEAGNRIQSTSELFNRDDLPPSVQAYIAAIQDREQGRENERIAALRASFGLGPEVPENFRAGLASLLGGASGGLPSFEGDVLPLQSRFSNTGRPLTTDAFSTGGGTNLRRQYLQRELRFANAELRRALRQGGERYAGPYERQVRLLRSMIEREPLLNAIQDPKGNFNFRVGGSVTAGEPEVRDYPVGGSVGAGLPDFGLSATGFQSTPRFEIINRARDFGRTPSIDRSFYEPYVSPDYDPSQPFYSADYSAQQYVGADGRVYTTPLGPSVSPALQAQRDRQAAAVALPSFPDASSPPQSFAGADFFGMGQPGDSLPRFRMGGSVNADKAREILRHGEVRGHPLTDKQRGFFGAKTKQMQEGGSMVTDEDIVGVGRQTGLPKFELHQGEVANIVPLKAPGRGGEVDKTALLRNLASITGRRTKLALPAVA